MLSEIVWTTDKLSVALGCAIPLVWIIGYFWYKTIVTKSEHDLKRALVERGMSVEEIERVVRVRPAGKVMPAERHCGVEQW